MMNLRNNNLNARKIEEMTPELKSVYLASGRVSVGRIDQVVKNDEGRNVFKTWYVAKIRGVIVGDEGEYKHETPEAAKKYGQEVLSKWKSEFFSELEAALEAASA